MGWGPSWPQAQTSPYFGPQGSGSLELPSLPHCPLLPLPLLGVCFFLPPGSCMCGSLCLTKGMLIIITVNTWYTLCPRDSSKVCSLIPLTSWVIVRTPDNCPQNLGLDNFSDWLEVRQSSKEQLEGWPWISSSLLRATPAGQGVVAPDTGLHPAWTLPVYVLDTGRPQASLH